MERTLCDKDGEAKMLRTMIMEKEGELKHAREKLNNELEAMAKRLKEKDVALEDLESLNQILLVKELKSNDQLQKKDGEVKKLRTMIMEKEGELKNAREKLNNELEAMAKRLKENDEALEDLESLNQILLVKELKSNDELHEARTKLINIFKERPGSCSIGVKRMGELESKVFHKSRKRNIRATGGELESAELCSLWEDYIRDPAWHPFRMIHTDYGMKEIIDDEDEKLKGLKKEYKDEVYDAVVKALMEMNEYNPSGRFVVPELWNFEEDRKASLKEGVEYLDKQWKTSKRNHMR
ncbi:hypothetical protein ACHQM5_022126 [Ranunculus cassubicifolius]